MAGEISLIFSSESQKSIDQINGQLKDVLGVVEQLNKTKVSFGNGAEKQSKSVKDLTEDEKVLLEVQKARDKVANDLIKQESKLVIAQSEQGKELVKLRSEISKTNAETKKAETAFGKLEIAQKKAEQAAKEIGATLGKESEEFKKAAKISADLKQEIVDIAKATGDSQPNIGRYGTQWESLVPGLNSVNSALGSIGVNTDVITQKEGGVKGFFNTFKGGLKSVLQGLKAFILSPVGAVITALATVGVLAKKFFDFNKEIAKTNALVEQLANTSGKATDKLREQATAISKAYDIDLNESIKELIELQRDFGISSEEAFDIYNKGLAQGGAGSNDFGDSIREYGGLFAQAGFSADEFINLLNTGIDLGIYNDKLPDAIKEAGLSLNEQTKSTRDALVNAFGESFTDDILKRIKTGETSIKDALQEIAEQSEKTQLNLQQQAQLTADVFKGAGEDAGGALAIFEALNESVKLQAKELTPLQAAYQKNAELLNEFENAQTRAFKSDSAIIFAQKSKNAFTEFKTGVLNAFASVRDSLVEFDLATKRIGASNAATYPLIPKLAKAAFNDLINILKETAKKAIEFGGVIGKALTGDFTGAKEQFNSIDKLNLKFTETEKVLKEIEIARKNASDDFISNIEAENKVLLEQANAQEKAKKLAEEQAQAEAEAKKLAEEQAQAEAERLASIREINRTELEQAKFVLDEKLKELKLNKDISKLSAEELSARIKLEQEYQDVVDEISEKELLTTLNKLENLKSEADLYAKNITQLQALLSSQNLSKENQEQINKELEFYNSKLNEANQGLKDLGYEYQEVYDWSKALTDEITKTNQKADDATYKLTQAFKNGEISAKEFKDGLIDINSTLQKDLVNNTINALEKILAEEKLTADESLKVEQELAKAKQDLRDAEVEEEKEKAEKILDNEKRVQSEIKEAKFKAGQDALEIASMVAETLIANKITELEEEFNIIASAEQRKQEYNATLLEQGAITQEEFNARKVRSDKKLADEQRKLEIQKAKEQKKQALIQAAINTAAAILQAIAQFGPPPSPAGIAGIASAALLGAVQIAVIASQKIPQFAKGKKKSDPYVGIAEVGEKGAELVNYSDGTSHLFSKPTYTYLPKGTEVLTATQTKKELQKESPYLREIAKNTSKKGNITIINEVPTTTDISYYGGLR